MGEIIALLVAFSWTACALFFEYAGNKLGTVNLNLVRLIFAFLFLTLTLFFISGNPFPIEANGAAWLWMSASGLVGLLIGDYFLFNTYRLITARYGQLFMTLAPPFAAIIGFILLGEKLSPLAIVGMLISLIGIGISVHSARGKSGDESDGKRGGLPAWGIFCGIMAGLGQGGGIVLGKVGMLEYESSIVSANLMENTFYIPFAATLMRVITGIIGFAIVIQLGAGFKGFFRSCKHLKGMVAAAGGSIFGPFIGVSLSLMALNYTDIAIACTIMAMVPIFILLPEKLFFKRPVSMGQLIGAVISVSGVALFFI